jgi:hypothetical protein
MPNALNARGCCRLLNGKRRSHKHQNAPVGTSVRSVTWSRCTMRDRPFAWSFSRQADRSFIFCKDMSLTKNLHVCRRFDESHYFIRQWCAKPTRKHRLYWPRRAIGVFDGKVKRGINASRVKPKAFRHRQKKNHCQQYQVAHHP